MNMPTTIIMTTRETNKIRMRYLNWLEHFVYDKRFAHYTLLFKHLNLREFVPPLPMDDARAADGVSLRDRFAQKKGLSYDEVDYALGGPCSVLEMIIGLALRMEDTLMTDPTKGNRTGEWFWSMLTNLKLQGQTDERYDPEYVNERLDIFLNRTYRANGDGGLFTCYKSNCDMRETNIWYQMNYWLIEYMEKVEREDLKTRSIRRAARAARRR